jgi:hypothetical protein
MDHLGEIFALVYGFACVCVAIYLVILASRFVRAHERMADALDKISRKQSDGAKPGGV